MKAIVSSSIGAFIGTAVLALATGQAAAQSPSPSSAAQTSSAAADQVTITGCIQREADYRRSSATGAGGVAGTGVGTANEFVLASAMMATSATTATAGTSGTGAPAATGTTGASSSTAYELTGPNEGQAQTFVGKRVQIMGKVKAGDPAGGPTASVPGSQDLSLRELEVSSIRETSGTCTPMP